MKENLAILCCITGDFGFALANLLMGLQRHSPDLADRIMVYHDGMVEADEKLLAAMGPVEFRYYEPPVPLPEGQVPPISFARLEGFKLLKDFANVLCLDVDLLIRGDISGILDFRESGIALRTEPAALSSQFGPGIHELKEAEGVDMSPNFYNTGVMLLSDRLEQPDQMADWIYALVSRAPDDLWNYFDQSALNLMLPVFNVKVSPLPARFHNMICRDDRSFYDLSKDSLIVHTITRYKFWNFWRFPEWDRRYQDWLQMGGSSHPAVEKHFVSYVVCRLADFWKRLKKRSRPYRHPWRNRA